MRIASDVQQRLDALAERPAVRALVAALASHPDSEIYIVGGAVRDAILGRTSKDVDVLVRGIALEQLEATLRHAGRVIRQGTRFGVLRFMLKDTGDAASDASGIEIALPRTEYPTGRGGYRDVSITSDPQLALRQDLARRDFTINAMAYDLAHRALVDPFGGLRDLSRRIVRTVGEARDRFTEDLTRVLRAVRFAVTLQATLAASTKQAIRELAPRLLESRDGKRLVPNEMIGREFVLAFAVDPVGTIALLDELDLLPHLLPEVSALKGIQQYPKFHPEGDAFVHTLATLRALPRHASLTLSLAALFHDLGKAVDVQIQDLETRQRRPVSQPHAFFASDAYNPRTMRVQNIGHATTSEHLARTIVQRLVLTQFARDPHHALNIPDLFFMIRHHLLENIEKMRPHKAEQLLLYPDGRPRTELLALVRADAGADAPRARAAERRVQELLAAHAHTQATPLITGADLIDLGLKPGPRFVDLLAAVRDQQLSGTLRTKQAALAWVRERLAVSSQKS